MAGPDTGPVMFALVRAVLVVSALLVARGADVASVWAWRGQYLLAAALVALALGTVGTGPRLWRAAVLGVLGFTTVFLATVGLLGPVASNGVRVGVTLGVWTVLLVAVAVAWQQQNRPRLALDELPDTLADLPELLDGTETRALAEWVLGVATGAGVLAEQAERRWQQIEYARAVEALRNAMIGLNLLLQQLEASGHPLYRNVLAEALHRSGVDGYDQLNIVAHFNDPDVPRLFNDADIIAVLAAGCATLKGRDQTPPEQVASDLALFASRRHRDTTGS
jgi:hypothetical protein